MKNNLIFKNLKKVWFAFILSTIIYFLHFYSTGIKLNQSIIGLFGEYNPTISLKPKIIKILIYIGIGTITYFLPLIIMSFSFPKIEKNLKLDYFKKVKHYPESFFNQYTIMQITQSIHNVGLATKELLTTLFDLSGSMICIILILIQGLAIHWIFILIYIIYLLLMILIQGIFGKQIGPLVEEQVTTSKNFLGEITDILSNYNILCFFNSYDIKNEKINTIQNNNTNLYYKNLILSAFSNLLHSLNIGLILQTVMILVSIFLLKRGDISIISILIIFRLNGFMIGRMSQIGRGLNQINNQLAMANEALKILDSVTIQPSNKKGNTLLRLDGEIEIRNLTFAHESKILFYNANLKIKPGDRVCIVGDSGSGKTTLLKLMVRAIEPPLGTIFIDGHDICTLDSDWLRRQMGFVFQNNTLFNDTVFNNIKLYRNIPDQDVMDASMHAQIHDVIINKPMGYDTFIDTRNAKNNFSGGQLQRICIARAIAHQPSIIVGDELTSALDDRTANEVIDNLILNSKNKTMIFVTHNKSIMHKFNKIFCISNSIITNIK